MKIDALKLDMTRYDFLPRYFDGRKRIIFMKNSVSPTSSGEARSAFSRFVSFLTSLGGFEFALFARDGECTRFRLRLGVSRVCRLVIGSMACSDGLRQYASSHNQGTWLGCGMGVSPPTNFKMETFFAYTQKLKKARGKKPSKVPAAEKSTRPSDTTKQTKIRAALQKHLRLSSASQNVDH